MLVTCPKYRRYVQVIPIWYAEQQGASSATRYAALFIIEMICGFYCRADRTCSKNPAVVLEPDDFTFLGFCSLRGFGRSAGRPALSYFCSALLGCEQGDGVVDETLHISKIRHFDARPNRIRTS